MSETIRNKTKKIYNEKRNWFREVFFEDLKVIFLFKKKLIIAPVMYDNRLELEISIDKVEGTLFH